MLIPINQGILNETEAQCRNGSAANYDFQIDCCVNATIEGEEPAWFVRRDIFFAVPSSLFFVNLAQPFLTAAFRRDASRRRGR